MKKAEQVFIPAPGISHFASAAQFARILLDRYDHLSITILVIFAPGIEESLHSLAASDTRIRCINIPPAELGPPSSSKSIEKLASDYIASTKPFVEQAIMTEILSDDSVQLAGIVIDLFCTSMIDVAHKFKVPPYLFFTSSAAFLGFMLHLPVHHNKFGSEFGPTDVRRELCGHPNLGQMFGDYSGQHGVMRPSKSKPQGSNKDYKCFI